MNDLVVTVRLKGDSSGLVGEVKLGSAELNKMGLSARTAGAEADRARAPWDRHNAVVAKGGAVAAHTTASVNALRLAVLALATGMAGRVAASFVSAASEAENYRVRLNRLLGSQAEGNRMFKEAADYAGRVPFEYREIMGAATTLAGVMKGGVDEIREWLPLIGDLAAASGLTIEEATGQVVRMLSAGAAAADLFRERGVLAMLGFQAGVTYSTAETRKQLLEEFNRVDSKFRGAADDMGRTWTGLTSMLSDKWFAFRQQVMDAGPFETLKSLVKIALGSFDSDAEAMEERARVLGERIVDVAWDMAIGTAEVWDQVKPAVGVAGDFADDVIDGWNRLPDELKQWGLIGAVLFGRRGLAMLAAVLWGLDKVSEGIEGLDEVARRQGLQFQTPEDARRALEERRTNGDWMPGLPELSPQGRAVVDALEALPDRIAEALRRGFAPPPSWHAEPMDFWAPPPRGGDGAGILRGGAGSDTLAGGSLADQLRDLRARVEADRARERAAAAAKAAANPAWRQDPMDFWAPSPGIDHAKATEEINRAMTEVLPRAYDRAVASAARWRKETLAQLDPARRDYEELAAAVESVYQERIKVAQEQALEDSEHWADGATRFMRRYAREAQDMARQVEGALGRMVDTGEDNFVRYARGMQTLGETARNMADVIIDEFLRIQYRTTIGKIFDWTQTHDWDPIITDVFGGGQSQTGPVMHSGGIVGRDQTAMRDVHPSVFAGAGRYHQGGFPGLMPGEVPIIAQRGEGVFTAEQMRALGGAGRGEIVLRIVDSQGNEVPTRQRARPGGGVDVEVQLDRLTAKSIRRRGSETRRAIEELGGAEPLRGL
ncbi:MAG: phage tail tape measure C-terminal domain-containing protein [Alphaproteobacteria bacterium]